MPAQQTQSNFLAEMGAEFAKAWKEGADRPAEYSADYSDVPPFENGVAQLVSVKLAKYKPDVKSEELRGKWYFMAEAIILTPVKVKDDNGNVVKIAGKRTKIGPEPLCNTPKRQSRPTFKDHVLWIQNEIKKLGINTAGMSHEQLPALCKALTESNAKKPIFVKCRVWKGAKQETGPYAGKEPLAQHQWNGVEKDFNPAVDLAGGVDDDTAAVAAGTMPSRNGAPPAGGRPPVAAATAPAPLPENDNADGALDEPDLDALSAAAQAGFGKEQTSPAEKAAEVQLRQIAERHGIGTDAFDAADDFASVVAMIRAAQEGGGPGEATGPDDAPDDDVVAEPTADDAEAAPEPEPEPEPAEFVPKAGDTGKLKIKTKDGKVKTVPVNCTKVLKKDKKAELENLDDKRMKWTGDKAMAWDKVKWDRPA